MTVQLICEGSFFAEVGTETEVTQELQSEILPLDPQVVHKHWQGMTSRDPGPTELTALADSKEDGNTLKFIDKDATTLWDTIDSGSVTSRTSEAVVQPTNESTDPVEASQLQIMDNYKHLQHVTRTEPSAAPGSTINSSLGGIEEPVFPASQESLTTTQLVNEGEEFVEAGAGTELTEEFQSEILPPDPQVIHKHWQDMASRGPGSTDREMLTALVDSKENRNVALKFRGKDATTVLDTIDNILSEGWVPERTKFRAFQMLRRLAGDSLQVPGRYLVGSQARYVVDSLPFASGGFSDVRRGRLEEIVVAVKVLRPLAGPNLDKTREAFCKECVLWMNIDHPNLLRLIAVKIDLHEFSMISEMMTNGNIVAYVGCQKANRIELLRGVAKGLEHLHKLGIIHGDLKEQNILINNEIPPQACIADFGYSTFVSSVTFAPTRAGDRGTYGYMAPELFIAGAQPSKEADVYAFGVVVYEVITGTRPFEHLTPMQAMVRSLQGVKLSKPEGSAATGFGQGTWEFAESCWDKAPEQRPTAHEAVEHFELAAESSTVVDPGPAISGNHGQ